MASFCSISVTFFVTILQLTVFKQIVCDDSLIARTKFQIPPNFGQNLTAEIDKVLKENDTATRAIIKEALQYSQIVYYESDILLNEIEDIIPAIDLLNELAPVESLPVKLTLSLVYMNKTDGKFLVRRVNDIYYSWEANITNPNKTKLLKSLASFTLNFVSPRPHYQDMIYGNHHKAFHFVNYVKNFLSLYFGYHAIPVGIMWNANMQDHHLVKKQILDADFLIFCAGSFYNHGFPVFMEELDNYLKNLPPKNATLFLQKPSEITQDVSNLWKPDNLGYEFVYPLKETPQYQELSQNFVNKVCRKSTQLLNYMLLSWSDMRSQDVIIGNAVQNLSTDMVQKAGSRFKLIIPFLTMEEVNVDACALKDQFNKWSSNYEAVIMDEITWRTSARFKDDLSHCDGNVVNSTRPDLKILKVLIEFTNGIAKQWSTLDKCMSHLIGSYPKISEMVLDTIIFHDKDIKESTDIQQLISSAKQKYKIGCSIQYASMFSAVSYRNRYDEDTFKSALEGTLCSPIFALLDVMIWYTPEENGYNYLENQIFSAYSNIFLLREVFQNVFPQITVHVKFASDKDKRVLADLFNATVIVPSNHILH